MTHQSEKDLPKFHKTAGGLLGRTEGNVAEQARDDAATADLHADGDSGATPMGQHVSHGSHGSW